MTNTIKLTIDSCWYGGIESAYIIVTSPTGGYVRIDKWKFGKANLTDTQMDLVWKCVDAYDGTSNSNIELTAAEMNELKTIGNLTGTVYIKH